MPTIDPDPINTAAHPNTIPIAGVECRLVHSGGYAIHIAADAASPTLCGRLIHYEDNEAVAPDCKRCLKKVTRIVAPTEANARIELIAKLAVDIVVENASARIVYVPADQADYLRAGLRAALRRRCLTGRTVYIDDTVHVSSDQAFAQIPRHIRDQRNWAILDGLDNPDSVPSSRSAQEIDWRTWAL